MGGSHAHVVPCSKISLVLFMSWTYFPASCDSDFILVGLGLKNLWGAKWFMGSSSVSTSGLRQSNSVLGS